MTALVVLGLLAWMVAMCSYGWHREIVRRARWMPLNLYVSPWLYTQGNYTIGTTLTVKTLWMAS